ncbi:UDP-N-acetylmuramate dehydrogenase [Candidatus Saccharibacteria bacterium]|nr:UDP-N-acetylmuramate dehydrogenase [Candidatus Saccharibacteria bacterium]
MKIRENILIAELTTMQIGGPARYVAEVETLQDIDTIYRFAETNLFPTFFLGGGANTIGHDDGFSGVIIINAMRGIKDEDGLLTIMGGEPWDNVVEYACSKGYTGIEALSKIPGNAAAAPVQNIGAYGQDISQVFVSAEVYDTTTKSFKTLQKSDLNFGYRKSILNSTARGRYFVLSITLRLSKGQMSRPFYNSIEAYIEENHSTDFSPQDIREIVSTIRAAKLPDPAEQPSSGSFFKNVYLDWQEAEKAEEKHYPVHRGHDGNKINSGWLIEQAGFKGQILYGMRVCPTAALVLINESAYSYENLAKARNQIASKVYDMFGYQLEQEPVEIINPKKNYQAPGATPFYDHA